MISHNSSFEYNDETFNIPITKSITTLTIGEFGIDPQPTELDLSAQSDEKVKLFVGMQSLIKSCVDTAEDIKNCLHQILMNEPKRRTEEERVELMKLDFMKLKQWFMDDIRQTKIYKEFSEFNSTKKLKTYSQCFNTFIVDRNKYTHGQLCFLKPNYEFVLEYIETPSHQKRYAYVDTAILKSYNDCYINIKKLITEYSTIHQTRITGIYNKTRGI